MRPKWPIHMLAVRVALVARSGRTLLLCSMAGAFTLRLLLIAVILNKSSAGDTHTPGNSTGDDLLARHKRTLIYNINGGVAKV